MLSPKGSRRSCIVSSKPLFKPLLIELMAVSLNTLYSCESDSSDDTQVAMTDSKERDT
jgi:hypothetical protein